MKELSLNILDITENSVKAGATLTEISINETEDKLVISIKDDGCGMSEETVRSVTDPFYTTRTTRSVGLGIPLFKLAAEQTGGGLEIVSDTGEHHGTTVTARFYKNHLDFTPLGDVAVGEDVADAVFYFAAHARNTTGAELVVDGGNTVQLYPIIPQ